MDRPNLTRILTKLEQRGFITRNRPPNDNRSYRITLTKKGREMKEPLTKLVQDHLEAAFTGLSRKEYETGLMVLQTLITNISKLM